MIGAASFSLDLSLFSPGWRGCWIAPTKSWPAAP